MYGGILIENWRAVPLCAHLVSHATVLVILANRSHLIIFAERPQ